MKLCAVSSHALDYDDYVVDDDDDDGDEDEQRHCEERW